MSKFTKSPWEYERDGLQDCYWINQKGISRKHAKTNNEANARLIAAAPEMYELLKEELNPTSDYGGTVSFARERKVRELLARIDGIN